MFSQARFVADLGEPQDLTAYIDGLKQLLDEERFPALKRAVEDGIFDPGGDEPDDDFRFGLERVLDGIERLVDQRG